MRKLYEMSMIVGMLVVLFLVFPGSAEAGRRMPIEKSEPVLSFYNGLGSFSEIIGAGGKVMFANFTVGLEGDALTLLRSSDISFPATLSNNGMVKFWVIPHFDIASMPIGSIVRLFEAKDSDSSPLTLLVCNSESGPMVILEIENSDGDHSQIHLNVNSFETDKWNQIACKWNFNQSNPRYSWGKISINREKSRRIRGFGKGIDLSGVSKISFGDDNFQFHDGDIMTLENLSIYDGRIPNFFVRSDWREYKDLR